jgi:RecB family exonuclease
MLAHRVFARHLTVGSIAEEDFALACREEIGQSMNPKLGSLHLRPSELRGVIAEVGALYERFQAAALEGCRSVEAEIVATVSADVTLRGRIDAIFDDARGVRLVDWKTGALGGAQDQLSFYALLWGLEHGELPAVVEAASVASGERYEEAPTIASATATARRIVDLVAALRAGFADAGSVPRVGGPGCRYCPLREDCEEGVAALRVLSA